jgi:hypothetical protein
MFHTADTPACTTAIDAAGLSVEGGRFLEDLTLRSFRFFWEQADPATGIIRDRARTDGSPSESARDVGSIASVGFGLSGLCIAAERGWLPRASAVDRARTTLQFFGRRMNHEHGCAGFTKWKNQRIAMNRS